jgi:hypothetical protein
MPKSFLNQPNTVRGLRNNNPGNLKLTSIAWQGKIPNSQNTDKVFEQFSTLKHGIRAMLKDLINDISKGKNTVKKLISEYAPATENNTKAYINSVCSSIGVTPEQKITSVNRKFLFMLARSIMKVELGNSHLQVNDSDIEEAIDILGDASTPTLKVNTSWLKSVIPALLFIAFFF